MKHQYEGPSDLWLFWWWTHFTKGTWFVSWRRNRNNMGVQILPFLDYWEIELYVLSHLFQSPVHSININTYKEKAENLFIKDLTSDCQPRAAVVRDPGRLGGEDCVWGLAEGCWVLLPVVLLSCGFHIHWIFNIHWVQILNPWWVENKRAKKKTFFES